MPHHAENIFISPVNHRGDHQVGYGLIGRFLKIGDGRSSTIRRGGWRFNLRIRTAVLNQFEHGLRRIANEAYPIVGQDISFYAFFILAIDGAPNGTNINRNIISLKVQVGRFIVLFGVLA